MTERALPKPAPSRTARAVAASFTAAWLLVTSAPAVSGQRSEPESRASAGLPIENAAERDRTTTVRTEPWPLRPDPRPEAGGAGCPADAHYMLLIGGLALRLGPGRGFSSAAPVERRWPTWISDLPRCGDGRSIEVRWLYFNLASFTSLPRDCWAAGVPPGPDGPACAATPEGLRAGLQYFVRGLPTDITLTAQTASAASSSEEILSRGLTIARRTPLGHEALISPFPSGEPFGRVIYRLPRLGEGAEALGPLLVECHTARSPNPTPPERIQSPHTCEVNFHLSHAGVAVNYRFPREIFDEPDWQALDLRVRHWIQERTAVAPHR
ncbi:hypothetical protein [Roseomonas fluvialis]|uniref:Uncharacterized protein n=1 Tax=Roseomonas fluvialis TaxID=1750527 RepID=A0ABN6P016_9PROT|nr:hypothetical protein [Roseomonas fluvialis]BDG71909.1 hypothetical protein Rmf_18380 [Roseomonas fluvialis]